MMRWRNILALLIGPLGAPLTFSIWDKLAYEPRNVIEIFSSPPQMVRYATPVAYIATTLLGIPVILILSRKGRLTFPVIVIGGTLIGTITGLFIGFYINAFKISELVEYFSFDFIAIYAPAVMSGLVSSVIYWTVRGSDHVNLRKGDVQ